MSRQLSNWDIIWCFLQLEDLLVDELALLVHDEVWIQRALLALFIRTLLTSARPWECDAGEAGVDGKVGGVLAVAALDVERGGFAAERAGADDDAGDADEVRDIGGCEAADGSLRDGGVDEELVFGECLGETEVFFAAGGVEDALGARLERRFELQHTSAHVTVRLSTQTCIQLV